MEATEFRRIIHKAHESVAPDYGALSLGGDIPRNTLAHWNYIRNVAGPISTIVREHAVSAPFTVLDAGCGNGQLFHLYSGLGARAIYGVDFSMNMLLQACERAKKNNFTFIPVRGSLENLDFFRGSPFDLINFYGVIEHVMHPGQVLDELTRVLAPGGLLIVGIPRKGSLAWLTYALFHPSLDQFDGTKKWGERIFMQRKMTLYRFFSKKEIRNLILHLKEVRVVARLPIAYGGVLGAGARILEKAAKRGRYDLIDRWNRLAEICGMRPAGEYVALRKCS